MTDLLDAEACRRGCTYSPMNDEEPKPVPAAVGHYCDRDAAIITTGLHSAIGLAGHIPTLIPMLAAKRSTESMRTKGDAAPLPMSVSALDSLNWLFERLVDWGQRWSTVLGVPAPALPRRVWRDSTGSVIGLPFGTSAEDIYEAIRTQATWQLRHRDMILSTNRDLAVELWIEDLQRISRLTTRYPLTDRPSYSKSALCPDDGGRLLVVPPIFWGDDRQIMCSVCGRHFTEAEHDYFGQLLVEMVKREKKAA